ncbi:MAG: FixH family protein, partial [Thermoleophilaceae bacterium]
MTTRLTVLAVIAAALAAPAAASAGGWATVGLEPPPRALPPGEPWRAELTVLQHGVTPLEDVRPSVIVSPQAGGEEKTFPARATGEPGVYLATVVFPSAGTWSYVVDDDFSARHTFPPVQIGKGGERSVVAPAAFTTPGEPGDDGPNYVLAALAAAVAALAAGLVAAAVQRRRGGPS